MYQVADVHNFADVARVHVLYEDLERQDGWKDFMSRLKVMRDQILDELVRGTVDKFGHTRDDEKRAVLAYLDRLFLFPRIIHEQYSTLQAKQQEMAKKATERGDIHANEVFR